MTTEERLVLLESTLGYLLYVLTDDIVNTKYGLNKARDNYLVKHYNLETDNDDQEKS